VFNRRAIAALAVLALVVGACGSSSASKAPAGSAGAGSTDAANPTVGRPSMAAAGGGSCSIDVKGDVTKSWQDTQDVGSLLLSYWLSPSERSMLSLKDNDVALILNCQSDQGAISFTLANDTTTAEFAKGPGQYQIASGGILSGGKPGQVQMIVDLKDEDVWRVAEGGTFTVTALADRRFAGTFQAKLQKLADNLKDVAGSATVTGSFDLGCTSGACG
jgi:hypothetical protein